MAIAGARHKRVARVEEQPAPIVAHGPRQVSAGSLESEAADGRAFRGSRPAWIAGGATDYPAASGGVVERLAVSLSRCGIGVVIACEAVHRQKYEMLSVGRDVSACRSGAARVTPGYPVATVAGAEGGDVRQWNTGMPKIKIRLSVGALARDELAVGNEVDVAAVL